MTDWRSFTIPGEPVPWARAGTMGKRHFTPEKQRSFMGIIKLYGSRCMAGEPPMAGPIELRITAVYGIPASWSKKRRADPRELWKTTKPDTGNLAKIVEDALNAVCWVDDAHISQNGFLKRYGEIPRLIVRFRQCEGAPPDEA